MQDITKLVDNLVCDCKFNFYDVKQNTDNLIKEGCSFGQIYLFVSHIVTREFFNEFLQEEYGETLL